MPRSHSATDKYNGSFAFSSPGRSAQCAARRHHRISILHGLPISRRAGRARLAIRWTCEANKKGTSNTLWKTERSEEHTSELQSLMRISYAVFCLQKKNKKIK